MIINTIDISFPALSLIQENARLSFKETNAFLKEQCGIINFFEKEADFEQLKAALEINFLQRKSSIYNGKPMYSIFGVGEYSFKPYKVAISGLYKQTKFTLVKPNGTALLLDDTCYFIGFDTFEDAVKTQSELNNLEMQEFIQSFMFTDAKRAITKDLLMRICLKTIVGHLKSQIIQFAPLPENPAV